MKNIIKTIWKRLQIWDGFWSIPLTVAGFILTGAAGQWFFSDENGEGAPGFFDPSYIHGAVMAASIAVIFSFTALLGWYFNARGLFRYFYGKDIKDDFKTTPVWFRISFALLPYLLYLVLVYSIFRTVVGR
jgi:hypothetical protein